MPRNDYRSDSNPNHASFNRSYTYDDYASDGNVTSGRLPFEEIDEVRSRKEAWEKIDQETATGEDVVNYHYDLRNDYENYPKSRRRSEPRVDHSGKGPKSWKRSDARILEEVNEVLFRSPDVDATDIEVKVQDCAVSLTGFVNTRSEKRAAEECVERISGVNDVRNEIHIRRGNATL